MIKPAITSSNASMLTRNPLGKNMDRIIAIPADNRHIPRMKESFFTVSTSFCLLHCMHMAKNLTKYRQSNILYLYAKGF